MSGGLRIGRRGGLDHAGVARLAPGGDIVAPDASPEPTSGADVLADFFLRALRFATGGRPAGAACRIGLLADRLNPSGATDAELSRRLCVSRSRLCQVSRALEKVMPELAPRRRKGGAR